MRSRRSIPADLGEVAARRLAGLSAPSRSWVPVQPPGAVADRGDDRLGDPVDGPDVTPRSPAQQIKAGTRQTAEPTTKGS